MNDFRNVEVRRPIQVIVPPPPSDSIQRNGNTTNVSVQRALQYTPLTTSVLPAHDRVPLPQICRAKESARMTSSIERKAMQQTLKECPVTKVKDRLAGLLKADLLEEIKFKQRPTDPSNIQPAAKDLLGRPEYNLTPTARMILDMANIDYRYPLQYAPIKPFQPIKQEELMPDAVHSMPTTPVLPGVSTPVQQSSSRLPTPNHTPTENAGSDPRPILVHVPKLPSNFRRADYIAAPDSPKRRKLSHDGGVMETPLHVRSQKDSSDAALLQFQDSLMEIFEAQDQLDAGSTNAQEANYFELRDHIEDAEPQLSLKSLERLQIGLRKLVDLKRLTDISVEHLRRLQRLCEPVIDKAQTVNLKVQNDMSQEDEEEWLARLQSVESGLASAAVCLYTVLGCPHEDSLLSTEARSWTPNVLVNLFENCLITMIESRADGQDTDAFTLAIRNKDRVKRVLDGGKKLLDVATTVCTEVKGTDSSVNPLEFLCAKLIFVQNATTDRNSCLGIQIYEKVRKVAMSCLARIYARYPNERQTVLDEILTSLDKLPSNSRSARQYRLLDGKSIQLVTALFMQLVQTTCLDVPIHEGKSKRKNTRKTNKALNESDDEDPEDAVDVREDSPIDSCQGPITRLQNKATTLFDSSFRGAQEIVMYLVSKASKTTKTGDSPYRNVLDLFIEDLVTVLPSPEWPSSEMMLRLLARKMIDLAQNDKAASIKNMALESLGVMGSAVSSLKATMPSLTAVVDREGRPQSGTSKQLCDLAKEYQEAGWLHPKELVSIDGPFAVVSRHLCADLGQSLRSRSAGGYLTAHYATVLVRSQDADRVDQNDIEHQLVRASNWLLELIPQIGSNSVDIYSFDPVSAEEVELAYTLCILNTGFCTALPHMTKTLTASFSSDQAQVRSRSLKSVVTMLEADSSLLDRQESIVDDVFKCASDDSAMVRDSALSLIARFIVSRPHLRQRGIKRLLDCASDAKIGVQKRAMSHLRDIHLKEDRQDLKAIISYTFLLRTKDHEDTVADLAKKMLTELWIAPAVAKLSDPVESRRKIAVERLSTEIVRCIAYKADELPFLLQKFLTTSLTDDSKSVGRVRELCSLIVEDLFDKTISGATDQGPLHTLTSFAAADSQLIQPERLAKLQHYLANIKTENDLFMFKSVIRIYRSVLPDLSASHKTLLFDIQSALLKAIAALGRRTELDSLMSCLSTIDGVLGNKLKLVTLAVSVCSKLNQFKDKPQNLVRLLRIAGAFSRHLDVEVHALEFAKGLKGDYKGDKSIASHFAATFHSMTKPPQPLEVRVAALESLGSLCQADPTWFNKPNIRSTFFAVFKDNDKGDTAMQRERLKGVVLQLFDELYSSRAQTKEGVEDPAEDKELQEQQELGKLGGDSRTRDGDSAVLIITRDVVHHALKVALSVQGENAILATKILASVSHEGLIHPKQSTGAFVALGTSPDERVAIVAQEAQQLLHQTHESVIDREYPHAIQQAFDYQYKVINDSCGGRSDGYKAKLGKCFEIINTSGPKYIRKFLSSLVNRVGADLAAQDKRGHGKDQVLFARFVMQNLAFFEYARLDDLLHTILQLELAYSKSGGEVVQMLEKSLVPRSIESNHLQGASDGGEVSSEPSAPAGAESVNTIRRLAPVAVTLTLMLETRSYLRRQYGIGRDVRAAIANSKQSKDGNKVLVRVHGISGERYWTKTNTVVASLDNEADMMACCNELVALMNIDEDVEVDTNVTVGVEITNDAVLVGINGRSRSGTPGARKRKGSASLGNTPVKKARGRQRKELRRSTSVSSVENADDDYDG